MSQAANHQKLKEDEKAEILNEIKKMIQEMAEAQKAAFQSALEASSKTATENIKSTIESFVSRIEEMLTKHSKRENEENETKKSFQDFLATSMAKQDAQSSKQDAQNSKINDSLAVLQAASQQTRDRIKRIDSSLSQNQEDIKTMKRDIDANANKLAPAQTRPLDKAAEPEPGAKKTKTQS